MTALPNFELKFSSSKGDYTLTVDFLAVLYKGKIPFTYLVPHEIIITTTDQVAISQISSCLLSSLLSHVNETTNAMLVHANESYWILYGRRERRVPDEMADDVVGDESGIVMRVVARMITAHALSGITRPVLQPGQSSILVKKVRSALDDHQVKNRKRKRGSVVENVQVVREVVDETLDASHSVRKNDGKGSAKSMGIQTKDTPDSVQVKDSHVKLKTLDSTVPLTTPDKVTKDKLKKMIVTLLSLQGISKKDSAFKDLYQHVLQAASFALRHVRTDDMTLWESRAMSVNHSLLRIFLGDGHKDV